MHTIKFKRIQLINIKVDLFNQLWNEGLKIVAVLPKNISSLTLNLVCLFAKGNNKITTIHHSVIWLLLPTVVRYRKKGAGIGNRLRDCLRAKHKGSRYNYLNYNSLHLSIYPSRWSRLLLSSVIERHRPMEDKRNGHYVPSPLNEFSSQRSDIPL